MQHPSLLARREGRRPLRRDRRGLAPEHATALLGRGGLSEGGGVRDRAPLLPLLSAVSVTESGYSSIRGRGMTLMKISSSPITTNRPMPSDGPAILRPGRLDGEENGNLLTLTFQSGPRCQDSLGEVLRCV